MAAVEKVLNICEITRNIITSAAMTTTSLTERLICVHTNKQMANMISPTPQSSPVNGSSSPFYVGLEMFRDRC